MRLDQKMHLPDDCIIGFIIGKSTNQNGIPVLLSLAVGKGFIFLMNASLINNRRRNGNQNSTNSFSSPKILVHTLFLIMEEYFPPPRKPPIVFSSQNNCIVLGHK